MLKISLWTECFKEPLRPLTVPIEYFLKKTQSFLLYIIYIHLKKKKIFIELYVILWKAKYNPWFSRL